MLMLHIATGYAVEITPIVGHRGGGYFKHIDSEQSLKLKEDTSAGVILGFKYANMQEIELFYSRYSTTLKSGSTALAVSDLFDLDIHYLHIGGAVLSEATDTIKPFLSGGLGMTYFSPALDGADTETRPSLSIGAGIKWMPSKSLGLRLEARGYGTLFNSNSAVFCSGGCRIRVSGDLLTQYEFFAGLIFRLD